MQQKQLRRLRGGRFTLVLNSSIAGSPEPLVLPTPKYSSMLLILFGVCLIPRGVIALPAGGEADPRAIEALQAIHDDVERIKNQSVKAIARASCSECYEELDCFDRCKGVLSYVNELPHPPEEISTRFTIYSREHRSRGVDFTYRNVMPATAFLDRPRKLVFIAHGFNSAASTRWMIELRESILNADDVIVITIDWSRGCRIGTGYARAVVNTELVARQTAVVLHKLTKFSPQNVKSRKTHFIGHSLGAQMGKFFSEYFRKLSNNSLIGRITALDAAAPLFESHNVSLSRSDALFIDGIHTSAGNDILRGKLGVTRQVGHIDFYVNGGSSQPGCGIIDLDCSHKRAHDYYIESIRLRKSCIFRSYACVGGLEEYRAGECHRRPKFYSAIGFDGMLAMPGRGVEFVDTRSSPPYCKRILGKFP